MSGASVAIPTDLLFLIGPNGSGKSSVLQALAFVQYFAQGNTRNFFEDRGWNRQEIRSRVGETKANTLDFELLLEDRGTEVLWKFTWGLGSGLLLGEDIWLRTDANEAPTRILRYRRRVRLTQLKTKSPLEALRAEGSTLALFEPEALAPGYEEILDKVFQWGCGVTSLELLSPVAMRRGARGRPQDIGPRGERLAGFLASLDARKKSRLVERVAQFYPLRNIETTRKRAGWIDLLVAERFRDLGATRAAHMSDGFLRILALCAIPEFHENVSLVLLDEVEDGIEPHVLPKLIRRVAKQSTAQLILTSHSPLLINFFDADEICFMARDPAGPALASKLDALRVFKTGAEYFGSGEIWANTSLDAITTEVIRSERQRSQHDNGSGGATEDARAFMDGQ